MNKTEAEDISREDEINLFAQQIRREVESYQSGAKHVDVSQQVNMNQDDVTHEELTLFPWYSFQPDFEIHSEYGVHELLKFHDDKFICNAYLALLGRQADPNGLDIWLHRLRSGMGKVSILGRIRYSKEGRSQAVKVKGLLVRFLSAQVLSIPLLGYLMKLLLGWFLLPLSNRNQAQFQAYVMALESKKESYLNSMSSLLESELNKLFETKKSVTELHQEVSRLETELRQADSDIEQSALSK